MNITKYIPNRAKSFFILKKIVNATKLKFSFFKASQIDEKNRIKTMNI